MTALSVHTSVVSSLHIDSSFPVLFRRGLSHHLPLAASMCSALVALCQPAGCSKGEQLFRDGDCGSGRLCTSRGSMESSSKLSFCWISCRKTALHMLPFPGRWGWRRARSLLCTGTICLFLSLSPPTDESVAQTWSLFLPLSYKLA